MAEEVPAAGGVHHNPAFYTPLGGGEQGIGDIVHITARFPDVKHHINAVFSIIDIFDNLA